MTLKIGRIAYLNVEPYFHYLEKQGFSGEIVRGVPSQLNKMLASGLIDACPSSSFEYALNSEDYLILPGQSISSVGAVQSVLLFSPEPIDNLSSQQVEITGESATSVNLLRVLLKEFLGIKEIVFKQTSCDVNVCIEEGRNVLLIGDRALVASRECPEKTVISDLGALWYDFTGLPFVFALWILRKEAVRKHTHAISKLALQIQSSRRYAFDHLTEMAIHFSLQSGFSVSQLEGYWRQMSYELSEKHLDGLRLFYVLCQKHGLLKGTPDFNFL